VIFTELWHSVPVRALIVLAAAAAALGAAPTSSAAVAPVRWCGTDVAQTDRARDRMGGAQVHVIYAVPADGQDRFAELASPIATDVAAIDAWWRREDPTRAPRFDLFDFPGCDSRMGLLDLSSVRLPGPTSAYAALQGRFEGVTRDLFGLRFAEFDKRYVVFYDGLVPDDGVCGTGAGRESRGPAYAVVYLRSSCELTVGDGRGAAWVAVHELLHAFGAVSDFAPHACRSGHVCDGAEDLMAALYNGGFLEEARLDLGRDDYYGHGGSLTDVRSSAWLLDTSAQLALTLRVTGRGVIGSEPDGQGCNALCVTEWDGGTAVQLAAAPGAGFGFAGWTGPCAAQREPSCLIDVGASVEVGAVFRPLRRLTVQVTGRGTVTGAGLRCSRSCARQLVEGRPVALRASAARGWRFVRWTGSCRGVRPTCTVRMAAASRIAALFARRS
jgi:hypothetical protein